jgi:hypothetical protein
MFGALVHRLASPHSTARGSALRAAVGGCGAGMAIKFCLWTKIQKFINLKRSLSKKLALYIMRH